MSNQIGGVISYEDGDEKKIINEEANYKTLETAYLEFIKNNALPYETFYYVQSSTGGMKGGDGDYYYYAQDDKLIFFGKSVRTNAYKNGKLQEKKTISKNSLLKDEAKKEKYS